MREGEGDETCLHVLMVVLSRLTSAKGLQAIVSDFPKVKFKGKGHEVYELILITIIV